MHVRILGLALKQLSESSVDNFWLTYRFDWPQKCPPSQRQKCHYTFALYCTALYSNCTKTNDGKSKIMRGLYTDNLHM